MTTLAELAARIRACRVCEGKIPEPRPVFRASKTARVAICGQAPGVRVHESGIPWNDPSGVRLRHWLGLAPEDFYNEDKIAIVPMGFCFPGHDAKGGDRPPRPECARTWHGDLFAALPRLELKMLVGSHAQAWHLKERRKASMTETIRAHREYAPGFVPLPHPSWRNNTWLIRNPWFEAEVLVPLRARLKAMLA